ncbi:MAG: hypothetical protein WC710_14125 [Gallionella sp.]|jgi:hypothetical protein
MMAITDGTTGSEQKYMIGNEVLEPYQVDERREWLAPYPRKLAQFNKALVAITETWVWRKQPCRFEPSGYTFARENVVYTDAQGKQI